MGQLDILKSYQPQNFVPEAALSNSLSEYEFRTADVYANPEHFSMAGIPGPFTPAGISETTRSEFLQDRWSWPTTSAMIVTVPDRPIDEGTYNNLKALQSGVYNQNNVIGTSKQYAGTAPTSGIYTGFYSAQQDVTEKTGSYGTYRGDLYSELEEC